MIAGFDGTVCVWAKESRTGTILSFDLEVIPKKWSTQLGELLSWKL